MGGSLISSKTLYRLQKLKQIDRQVRKSLQEKKPIQIADAKLSSIQLFPFFELL